MLASFFFFFLIQTIKAHDAPQLIEYLQIRLRHYYGSLWDFQLFISNSSKSIKVIPDLNSSYTLIYDSQYSKPELEESSIINNHTQILYKGEPVQVALLRNTFKLEANKEAIIDLNYYYTHEYKASLNSIVGISYTFDNLNCSIVYQLLFKGIITSASFALINKFESNTMFFGGLPSRYTDNMNHSYINVIGNNNKWDFYISEVRIKNGTKEINYPQKKYAYLISLESFIFAPSDFFDKLVTEFFNELIEERHCHILNDRPNRYFLCSIHPRIRKGDIDFLIDDYLYTFPLEFLWSCGEEFCVFSVKENRIENQWIIGPYFYDTFNLFFDFGSKKINLYSKKVQIIKLNTNQSQNNLDSIKAKHNIAKSIITIEVLFCLIGILTLLYIQALIFKKP